MRRTVLGLLLFFTTAFLFAGCSLSKTDTTISTSVTTSNSVESTVTTVESTTTLTQTSILGTVTVEIIVSGDDPTTTDVVETEYVATEKEIDFHADETLFDLVNENFDITYDTYSFGHFVTKLDVLVPTASNYIGIYVNGIYSMEGIDSISVNDGDTYQFKLVSSDQ